MNATTSDSGATMAPLLPRRRHRSRRPVAIAAAAAVLAAAGWLAATRLRGGEPPVSYATAPAARTDLVKQVTATGTLKPVVEVQVGSQVSGRISELHADFNSRVEKGQVIARLEPELFESAVRQARARLASARADRDKAKAQLVNARADYDRMAGLVDTGAIARRELDAALAAKRTAEAQLSATESAITVARGALEQAQTNLEYTTIKSPIDGVVVSRNVDVGQTVAASLSAPVLFVIAEDLSKMEVHTSVAESDIGQVEPGMKATFTVDAYPDETFEGHVKQVRYAAETVSNVVTYDAVVAVGNDDLKLRPGMTTNVSFIVESRENVLAVPNKALMYRPPETIMAALRAKRGADGRGHRRPGARDGERPATRRVLFVLRAGVPTPVRVTTGLSDGSSTEVSGSDLHEGDQVITGDSAGGTATRRQNGNNDNRRRRRPGMRVL